MNTQEIAQAILDRRNRMNPVVMNGEMIATLGADGMQEALTRRWLRPDTDTGHLQVSTDMAVVEEMRAIAATKAPEATPQPITESRHGLALSHAFRPRQPLNELLAPGTGHDSSAPFQPTSPSTPTSSRPQTGAPGVGDEVMVAETGKTYTGTIGAVGQDGKYRVTFGNEKPPINRDYGSNELRVTKKAAMPGAPTA